MTESSINPIPVDHWAQQSPISIVHADAFRIVVRAGYLTVRYSEKPVLGQFVGEQGHRKFEIRKPSPSHSVALDHATANLVQIHLHAPSEHEIDGSKRRGEIHLVHEIVDPRLGSTMIVLGVFFDVKDAQAKRAFFDTWAKASSMAKASGDDVEIHPASLLPENCEQWYLYEGSLTSKPTRELVTWIVFPTSLDVASDDLRKIEQHAHQHGREIQPLNRRHVLRNFERRG